MEYWSDFKHQVHHEKELATVLNNTKKKQKIWDERFDMLVEKRENRAKKENIGKAKKKLEKTIIREKLQNMVETIIVVCIKLILVQ